MCRAMVACCCTPQWFSSERMTGYGDRWGVGMGVGSTEHQHPVPNPGLMVPALP